MVYASNAGNHDLSFGLSLMSHLPGNSSISPISIRTALAMLYEGAKGDTARQIAQVALLNYDAAQRQAEFSSVMGSLNVSDAPYVLRCANGLWVTNASQLNTSFMRAMESYHARVQSADFKGNPEGERVEINSWVSGITEGKIPELFPAGSINPLTVLALANALYFKAEWDDKFGAQYTQPQNFTLPGGEVVKVDMMRKGEVESRGQLPEFMYGEFDGVQAAMLLYKGHGLSAIFLLPPKGSSVEGLEEMLRAQATGVNGVSSLFGMHSTKFAQLELPRHELAGNYDLKAPLSAMGIDMIFSERDADLSGIGDRLWVNQGVHKTYFKTDEEGSEGAAATGFALTFRGMDLNRPVEFVADRPFLELVVNNSGAVLFINRVNDPRQR